jgi:UDP-N-acetylmuramate--alanine ligase
VLVAGAHGKTTTTSLISTIFAHGGLDPTVVIGGRLKATGSNARLGQGNFLVAEADESDGSFLKLSPTIGVVTNIDREHMDFFKTMDALKEAFSLLSIRFPLRASVVCIENEHVRELLPSVLRNTLLTDLPGSASLCRNIRKGFMSASLKRFIKAGISGFSNFPHRGYIIFSTALLP